MKRSFPACVLLLLLVALSLLGARAARADTPDCEVRCSVNRNCSSTGMACLPDDRECTGAAIEKGLEIKCEQQCPSGKRFVYCPADAGRGDSSFVWVLLALSGLLAVGGGAVAWTMLRKKA
jgi:hypothetical protein